MFSGILFIIIAWVITMDLGFSIFLTIWGSLCIILEFSICLIMFIKGGHE